MRKFFCTALALVTLFAFTACGDANRPTDEPLATAYDFLTEFYTPDKDGRYELLRKTLSEKPEQAFAAVAGYYTGIQPYMEEEAFNSVLNESIMYKHDGECVYKGNYGTVGVSVSVKSESDGVYEVEYSTDTKLKDGTVLNKSGVLTMSLVGERYKVTAMTEA